MKCKEIAKRANNQTSSITNSFKRTSVVSTNTEESSNKGFDFSKLQSKSAPIGGAPLIRNMLNSMNSEKD